MPTTQLPPKKASSHTQNPSDQTPTINLYNRSRPSESAHTRKSPSARRGSRASRLSRVAGNDGWEGVDCGVRDGGREGNRCGNNRGGGGADAAGPAYRTGRAERARGVGREVLWESDAVVFGVGLGGQTVGAAPVIDQAKVAG